MCGIVGFLDKRGGTERPVGRTLLAMLEALACRGPDSAGVAIFGSPSDGRLHMNVPAGQSRDEVVAALQPIGVAPHRDYGNGSYLACVSRNADLGSLERQIQQVLPGTEVLCMGEHISLFKQVGSPRQLDQTYGVSRLPGTHGIGHTRLSTESRVDLSHSQPFWAHGVPDLATVHNGHITN